MNNSVTIRDRQVGAGMRTYIIAEIGGNHNGDMGLARELIDAAVECGCDVVKFQLWEPGVWYTAAHFRANPVVRRELEEYACDREQHEMPKQHADSRGVHFASTAVTAEDTEFLVELGVDFMKIASMDADNPRYIRYVAEKNLPTILSTDSPPGAKPQRPWIVSDPNSSPISSCCTVSRCILRPTQR